MRIVFVGIYKIGVEALTALVARQANLVAVVTKPSTPSETQPVAVAARSLGLQMHEPESPRESAFLDAMRALEPELIVVAGYHKMFPHELLALPRLGVINLHLSLLPKYRGPAPWKWAIANGETISGATVVTMVDKADAGDILGQRSCAIHDDDTGETLFERLSVLGGKLLAETMELYVQGSATRIRQNETQASYQSAPTEEDARIDWTQSAVAIRNRVRGFHPRPGAWTRLGDVAVTLRKVALHSAMADAPPGTIVAIDADRVLVATGEGVLALEEYVGRATTSVVPVLRPGVRFG